MPTLEDVKAAFAPFIEKNPISSLTEETIDSEKVYIIQKPWGDESILLRTFSPFDELSNALNMVYLPPRLSALWHVDTNDLEVAWTALPIPDIIADVTTRSFDFTFKAETFRCEFGNSSSRLITIAGHSDNLSAGDTFGRNLASFRRYLLRSRSPEDEKRFENAVPTSFWIRNVTISEDKLLLMISHLNFYTEVYDTYSPFVLVHPPAKTTNNFKPRIRYIEGEFPKEINAVEIDSNLLNYWEAAQLGDAARRFAYYFRIIEYAATVYIDHSTRFQLRKILASPVIKSNRGSIEDEIISTVQKYKADEFAKMDAIIKDTVDPVTLWKQVEQNIEYFSRDIVFDGGFKLAKLVESGCRDSDFVVSAHTTFHKNIRDIRNALSHGQDKKTSTSILPTTHNHDNLRPWMLLIAVAAGEVMQFRDVG